MDTHDRSYQEISALLEASQAILTYGSFEESARAIFDACTGLIGATSGYVALLTDDGRENEVLFLESGGLPCTVDPSLPMPIRGLRAESYTTGRAVYDNDFMHSEWVDFMPEGHVVLENVMFAPLNLEGKTVGLLGMANKKGGFTDHDAHLATAFGDMAAIALNNSKMIDDITRREMQYRSVSDSAADAILTTDADGHVHSVNRAAETMFDAAADTIMGKNIRELFGLPDTGFSEMAGESMEVRGSRDNGTDFPAEISIGTWTMSGETHYCYVGRDITERIKHQHEREEMIATLQTSLDEVKRLQGLIPICMHCKKIRDDSGYWEEVEAYVHHRSEAEFSHSICPDCLKEHYPDYGDDM